MRASSQGLVERPTRIQTAGGWRFQCRPHDIRRGGAGRDDCDGFGGGEVRGHVITLSSAPTPLEPIRENVEHSTSGEGGAVPDGIHPGDGLPYIKERVSPGPQAQLISLLDPGVPLQLHPEGTHKVPWVAHVDTPPPPEHPNERGRDICGPPEGYPKDQGTG